MYTHDTLPTDGSFRLFVLEPGTGKQPLQGSLHTFKLDQAPYFEAISYVWGSPDRCVELICDNQPILITPSLSDVLHRVRLPDRSRTLWTDLVCINQADLDEKGSQVSLMGSIYRRCNRTLIHVGAQDHGDSERVLGLLNDIDQEIFANLQQGWGSAPIIPIKHPILHDTRWYSFRNLITTPWFWRGWVVQEAAYAQDGVVLWGEHEFSWTTVMKVMVWVFRRAAKVYRDFRLSMSYLHISCFSVLKRDAIRPFVHEDVLLGTAPGCILDVLHYARVHNLTDPRDMIYAFYDLPARDSSDRLQIIPSYHKTFLEVCRDFALNYLEIYGNLDLLIYVSHDENSLAENFPSWIPLWRYEFFWNTLPTVFAKGVPLIEEQDSKPSLVVGGNILRLRGVRFAKIRMMWKVFDQEQLTVEDIATLWSEVSVVQKINITAGCDRLSMFLVALCFGLRSRYTRRRINDMAAFALEIFESSTDEGKRAINHERWEEGAKRGNSYNFFSQVQTTSRNRRFIITDRGYGTAPALAQKEDECVVFRSGKMPFLLRKAVGAGNYKFIGTVSHSSEHEYENVDTSSRVSLGLNYGKDWIDSNSEEETICLL